MSTSSQPACARSRPITAFTICGVQPNCLLPRSTSPGSARSKLDRLVLSERLVEAGLTLVIEAQQLADNDFARARGIRNGLMIALLAVCPNRLKNFSTLEIGHTFKQVHGSWWIAVPAALTKSRRRPDERRVPEWLNNTIDLYLNQSRPVLLRSGSATNALWISSTAGPMTTKNLG